MFILIATDWTAQLPSSMYWSMTFMSWSGSQQESENSKYQHSACNTPSAYAVQRPGQVLSPYPHPSMHCSAPGEANVMVAHVAQRACADVQDAETRVCAERKPGDYREEEIKRLFFFFYQTYLFSSPVDDHWAEPLPVEVSHHGPLPAVSQLGLNTGLYSYFLSFYI